jgi:glycogen debranching enzyme
MAQQEIVVIGGQSFMLSDRLGDIEPGGRQGLFQADTRFLSCLQLTLDGRSPIELTADQEGGDRATFYATNAAMASIAPGTLSLKRQRHLNGHLSERIALTNYGLERVETIVRIELGADFADVLELRGLPAGKLGPSDTAPPPGWHHAFAYRRGSFARRTLARFSAPGRFCGHTAEFEVALSPGETWECELIASVDACDLPEPNPAPFTPARVRRECQRQQMHVIAPEPPPHHCVTPAYQRAGADLHSLRFQIPTGETSIGAGIPYFMALFGRDNLLTAYQALALDPNLAAGVLRALARYQGTVDDAATDQEPGKIPHEVRQGELAMLGDQPHRCYYGTVDATPLFLVLFSEYLRRTGDSELREELWPAAEAALDWIDRYGDRDGDGFVEYQRRSPKGLDNQGWKDSWDSIAFADGRLAEGPIALCEVQGYVYDAKLRMAELCEQRGMPQRAAASRTAAHRLRERFEAAFWLPRAGTYALALDGHKRAVDGIASNAAHCLWSGIVRPERAARVVARLLREDVFSGWGLRTLSTRMARYNPLGYHNGTVWPHDSVLAAAGFLRYGHTDAARELLDGLLSAAAALPEQRLPELFAGYPRGSGRCPVPYPDANVPQAWASGAVVLAVELLNQIDAGTATNAKGPARTAASGTSCLFSAAG